LDSKARIKNNDDRLIYIVLFLGVLLRDLINKINADNKNNPINISALPEI
jgi:hypothetical protein